MGQGPFLMPVIVPRGPLNRSKPNAHFPRAIFLGSTPHSGGTIVSPQAKCAFMATLRQYFQLFPLV